MAKKLSIVAAILLMTLAAAGVWIYMNPEALGQGAETEVAEVEPDPDLPTAERNLGRLGKHFKQAPVKEEKSGWGLW